VALLFGAAEVLRKPYRPAELLAAVGRAAGTP
jgi:DNA-binding response OmpR family regulator